MPVSVHAIERRSGSEAFEVRYRMGGRQHSRTFEDHTAAAEFDQGIQAWLAWQRAEEAWRALPDHVKRRVTD